MLYCRPVVAQARRSQAVANRMLRNTLQQPMRERRQQARRGARQRLGDSAGISGQVRMLTNSIERLQAQVVSLQHRGSSSTQAARRGGREARRGGHGALRGGGRFNNNNQVIRLMYMLLVYHTLLPFCTKCTVWSRVEYIRVAKIFHL